MWSSQGSQERWSLPLHILSLIFIYRIFSFFSHLLCLFIHVLSTYCELALLQLPALMERPFSKCNFCPSSHFTGPLSTEDNFSFSDSTLKFISHCHYIWGEDIINTDEFTRWVLFSLQDDFVFKSNLKAFPLGLYSPFWFFNYHYFLKMHPCGLLHLFM